MRATRADDKKTWLVQVDEGVEDPYQALRLAAREYMAVEKLTDDELRAGHYRISLWEALGEIPSEVLARHGLHIDRPGGARGLHLPGRRRGQHAPVDGTARGLTKDLGRPEHEECGRPQTARPGGDGCGQDG